jgi:hypothetical protein
VSIGSSLAVEAASRRRRALRLATAALLIAAAGYLLAFKRGWVEPRAVLFASLAGAASLGLAGVLVAAARELVRGRRRVAVLAEALAAGGLLAVALGGFAHWSFSMQGFVVAAEREPVRLARTGDILAFTTGPLADRRELNLTIGLARLELRSAGPDGFEVVSRLRVLDDAGEEVALSVSRRQPAPYRTLVFRQGAFGFAPRVVVVRDGRTLLDAFVPFRTVREGPDGVSFVGDFEIATEKLRFRGAVTLEDLNDDMKGHPRLELAVERDGAAVGKGTLRPGESASLSDGSRVAFSGLRRWSEIDFSRRTYPVPMLGGLAASLLGFLLWPLASWRRW